MSREELIAMIAEAMNTAEQLGLQILLKNCETGKFYINMYLNDPEISKEGATICRELLRLARWERNSIMTEAMERAR